MENKYQPNYELQYLLLHEIIETLAFSGLQISNIWKDGKHTPVENFEHESTGLRFGTLALLLNNPEDLPKNEDNNVQHLRELAIEVEQINQTKYTLKEIGNALYILKSNDEIAQESGTIWDNKPYFLKEKGHGSFASKKYLLKYQEAIKNERFNTTILQTNKRLSLFNGILAAAAALTLLFTLITETSKQHKSLQDQQGYLQPIKNSIEHLEVYQEQTSMALNHLSVSMDSLTRF